MLEHQKKVLEAVHIDRDLFRKELMKSLHWLDKQDQILLLEWVKETFTGQYKGIIDDIFFPKYNCAS